MARHMGICNCSTKPRTFCMAFWTSEPPKHNSCLQGGSQEAAKDRHSRMSGGSATSTCYASLGRLLTSYRPHSGEYLCGSETMSAPYESINAWHVDGVHCSSEKSHRMISRNWCKLPQNTINTGYWILDGRPEIRSHNRSSFGHAPQ